MLQMKYDTEFRNSKTGQRLYRVWRTVREVGCCARWHNFENFCDDVADTFTEDVTRICKIDRTRPYSQNNFKWAKRKEEKTDGEVIDSWNKTVNRIRKYYGMPSLEEEGKLI